MTGLKEVLTNAAKKAGTIIHQRFQGTFGITHKEGVNNLVTEVDKEAEAAILTTIRERFPEHGILTEEAGSFLKPSDYQWIIDPIDGTVNFAHGIPLCCVSIAVKYKDEIILGMVYNPMMNELFFAEKGKGAFLNDRPVRVSEKTDFSRAFLVTGFPYEWPADAREHPLRVFDRFVMQGLPVRRLGSAALDLCWVACGRFDGFWEYNLQPWDVAAGYLMVTEAGGRVTDFDNRPAGISGKQTLATNGHIHEEMLRLIRPGALD